jgi:2-dehydro-3-deoxyglucarate aldolase/4-hydroxy-2-oxoheptanedioate aldolase
MRDNEVRRTLAGGGSAIGLMVFEFGTPGVARMARAGGAEFVLYDMEHTGWSPETLKTLLDAARAAGITPFARVRDARRASVSQILDLGAMGIMVPMVDSAEQAREIVSHARYAPDGTRGVAVYHADDIEADGLPATLAKANREVLVIVQIETAAGVERCEEIAAVPGVDVVWIGPFDLTSSLSAPFGSDALAAAVDRILAAAAAAGKPAGSLANDVAHARELLAQGYRAIAFGDMPVMGTARARAFADARA